MSNDTQTNPQTWRRRLMTYAILILAFYGLYCGLLFAYQYKLMFPADLAGPVSTGPTFPDSEVLELATEEGVTRGWYLPAPGALSGHEPRPLVVFFHGNAELIDHQSAIVQMYHDLGVSVLLPEYRGYGHSDGSPSQKHIVADSLAMIDLVAERSEVDANRLVLHGRSIGGGLAAQVADRMQAESRSPSAVIVESTFVSVSGMAWRFGVPPLLVRSPLKTGKVFARSSYPVLIFHGKQDEIVPVSHAHELLKLAPNGKLLVFDCDHNTLPPPESAEAYEQAVRMHLVEAKVIMRNDQ